MDYNFFVQGLKEKIKGKNKTGDITKAIKDYTRDFFKDKNDLVFSSEENSEYLYDVSVLTFDPKNVINNVDEIKYFEYKAYLLLESELGGPSATAYTQVFKNVLEDYLKLLIGKSEYKIMIMGLSPKRKETNYIENRIEIMKEIYEKSECESSILLVVIEGSNKDENGQTIQIKLDTSKIHAFILKRQLPSTICTVNLD